MSGVVNTERMADGRVRAVCEWCGRKSRPSKPSPRGEVDLFEIAAGWSVAPYSPGFVHADGSTGDLWTCPACNRARFLVRLTPTPERQAARRVITP